MLDIHLKLATDTARAAGNAIMCFYKQENHVAFKQDGSPLTLADRAAHVVITNCLASSKIPCVSEEGKDRFLNKTQYWLVDPLDGTKDFLSGNDEFTVNIALVEKNRPVLGIVYAPALDELYAGSVEHPAHLMKAGFATRYCSTEKSISLRATVSRFHDHPDVSVFAASNEVGELIPTGSSLKYARLAFGKADVFPRLVGSSEWDTAAGQAVLESAGGSVLNWHTGKPLSYGKKLRRNPRLISFRAPYQFNDFKLKHYLPELL